ncbi:MAG: hypothetical protein HKM87_01965 [Ignavibacteriaceae bacterium]|nr:hypothetical protein [Ignavibacteriaceae bacterium]
MGQQQLLLVVLGLIIVSIAIGLSNQLFDAQAEDSNKDSIASELVNLGTLAQQFFNKPTEMGGGNQSYVNWNIPAELDSTTSGIYEIVNVQNKSIVISGKPFPQNGYRWYLQTTVKKSIIATEVIQL